MAGLDYKREYEDLYQPKNRPSIINVPKMTFIQVEGRGNLSIYQAYRDAMEILYSLSFTIKMSKVSDSQPAGYFKCVVPPLEGLWWYEGDEIFGGITMTDRSKSCWLFMIRQSELVTEDMFERAKESLKKRKPHVDFASTRLVRWEEGLYAQMIHLGPYDNEPATITLLNQFAEDNGYDTDITDTRRHHEIYLGDPRKAAPEWLKTVLRHPVRKHQ